MKQKIVPNLKILSKKYELKLNLKIAIKKY